MNKTQSTFNVRAQPEFKTCSFNWDIGKLIHSWFIVVILGNHDRWMLRLWILGLNRKDFLPTLWFPFIYSVLTQAGNSTLLQSVFWEFSPNHLNMRAIPLQCCGYLKQPQWATIFTWIYFDSFFFFFLKKVKLLKESDWFSVMLLCAHVVLWSSCHSISFTSDRQWKSNQYFSLCGNKVELTRQVGAWEMGISAY